MNVQTWKKYTLILKRQIFSKIINFTAMNFTWSELEILETIPLPHKTDCSGRDFNQRLKWSREAGGGAHLTKPGWSKPHTHSNPTNLALFRHKITLYRFNQGGSYYCRGGSNGSRGLSPRPIPPHFNHWFQPFHSITIYKV